MTLFRNNPQAANGMMSQETLDCDEMHIVHGDNLTTLAVTPNGKQRLLIFPANFAAVLVDTTDPH